jgi:hypothetical protein
LSGATLYVDVVETNPPLVFYEMIGLTFGTLTREAYMLGVCAVILVTFGWLLARAGRLQAVAGLLAMTVGAGLDFGQRDHIVVAFILPFLVLEGQSRKGEAAVGFWAFLGVGLKPHFILIPACAMIATAIQERSFGPLFSWRARSLAVSLIAYAGFVAAIHPAYLQEIVPLGLFVYWAYGQAYFESLRPLVLTILGLYALARGLVDGRPLLVRLSGALFGALAAFYLQGKNWPYHQVPAQSLILLILILIFFADKRIGRSACAILVSVCGLFGVAAYAAGGERQAYVPGDARSILFLSPHVWAAYPISLDRRLKQVSRYPALWPLPGAWSTYKDAKRSPADRNRAKAILMQTRRNILTDIRIGKPDYIYEDVRRRKPYFRAPFNYSGFLGNGLANYRPIGRHGMWLVYVRTDRPRSNAKAN